MAKYLAYCENILTGEIYEIITMECDNFNRHAMREVMYAMVTEMLFMETRRSIARVYRCGVDRIRHKRQYPIMIVECNWYMEGSRRYAQIVVNGEVVRVIQDIDKAYRGCLWGGVYA